MRKYLLGLFSLFLILFINVLQAQQKVIFPDEKHNFVVIAHRGDHTQAPENTLLALQHAIETGADYVEVDLRTTKDGHIVNIHDATVDRTTNGKGKVAEMTLKEFRKLRIRDARFPALKKMHPPTFQEILEMAKGKIHLYLDTKSVDPKQVYDQLRAYGMEYSVVVYAGAEDWRDWKAVAAHLPLMISPPRKASSVEDFYRFWKTQPVDILDGPYLAYTKEIVEAALSWGAHVWPDIQHPNEGPVMWDIPIQAGIRALQTDKPGELIAYLEKLGLRK